MLARALTVFSMTGMLCAPAAAQDAAMEAERARLFGQADECLARADHACALRAFEAASQIRIAASKAPFNAGTQVKSCDGCRPLLRACYGADRTIALRRQESWAAARDRTAKGTR